MPCGTWLEVRSTHTLRLSLIHILTTAPTWIRLPIHAPSRSTPCPTEDSGSVRLSFPLHPLESQSPRWGTCFALAPRGQELHLFEDQAIKDASFFLLSRPRSRSPAPSLFTGNGSHQQLIANAVQRGIGAVCLLYTSLPNKFATRGEISDDRLPVLAIGTAAQIGQAWAVCWPDSLSHGDGFDGSRELPAAFSMGWNVRAGFVPCSSAAPLADSGASQCFEARLRAAPASALPLGVSRLRFPSHQVARVPTSA